MGMRPARLAYVVPRHHPDPGVLRGVLVSSMSVMLGPALPLQKRRFGAQDRRNRVDFWTLGLAMVR